MTKPKRESYDKILKEAEAAAEEPEESPEATPEEVVEEPEVAEEPEVVDEPEEIPGQTTLKPRDRVEELEVVRAYLQGLVDKAENAVESANVKLSKAERMLWQLDQVMSLERKALESGEITEPEPDAPARKDDSATEMIPYQVATRDAGVFTPSWGENTRLFELVAQAIAASGSTKSVMEHEICVLGEDGELSGPIDIQTEVAAFESGTVFAVVEVDMVNAEEVEGEVVEPVDPLAGLPPASDENEL